MPIGLKQRTQLPLVVVDEHLEVTSPQTLYSQFTTEQTLTRAFSQMLALGPFHWNITLGSFRPCYLSIISLSETWHTFPRESLYIHSKNGGQQTKYPIGVQFGEPVSVWGTLTGV